MIWAYTTTFLSKKIFFFLLLYAFFFISSSSILWLLRATLNRTWLFGPSEAARMDVLWDLRSGTHNFIEFWSFYQLNWVKRLKTTHFFVFDATSKIVLICGLCEKPGGKFSNLGKKIIITYFLTVIGHAAFHILLSKGEGRKKIGPISFFGKFFFSNILSMLEVGRTLPKILSNFSWHTFAI